MKNSRKRQGKPKRYVAIACHGRNGYTLLYGLPPSWGFAVEDTRTGKLVPAKKGDQTGIGGAKKFLTARAALISTALRNRADREAGRVQKSR